MNTTQMKTSEQHRKDRGFTIVELLIVIVVLAILAAITAVAYSRISDRAKDSATLTVISNFDKRIGLNKVDSNSNTGILAKTYSQWGDIESLADQRGEFMQANGLTALKDSLCLYDYDLPRPHQQGQSPDESQLWSDRATSCGSPYTIGDTPNWDKGRVYVSVTWNSSTIVSYWSHMDQTWKTRDQGDGGQWQKVIDIDNYNKTSCTPFESHVMGQLEFDEQCRFTGFYYE